MAHGRKTLITGYSKITSLDNDHAMGVLYLIDKKEILSPTIKQMNRLRPFPSAVCTRNSSFMFRKQNQATHKHPGSCSTCSNRCHVILKTGITTNLSKKFQRNHMSSFLNHNRMQRRAI